MKKNPKVSIIIPVYNGADFLTQAIQSALSQTYKNIEIIVVNDGSTDSGASEKIAQSFGRRIKYYRKKNGGVASALNLGIKKMTGDYFSWLSHDDIYLPSKIKSQIKFLQTKPPKTIAYADFEIINQEGKILAQQKIPLKYQQKFIFYLIVVRFMHGCTLLIPKNAFAVAGIFNPKFKNVQDYDLWFRLIKKDFKFAHQNKLLVDSRIHKKQGSHQRVAQQLVEEDILYTKVLKDFIPTELFNSNHNPAKNYFALAVGLQNQGAFGAANLALSCGHRYIKTLAGFLFYWYCRCRPIIS